MNLISRYGDGGIVINGRSLAAPFIVAPGFLHEDWIASVEALTADSLSPLWPLETRIVLLGIAGNCAPPLRELRHLLAGRQMALESMELGAACRTYNVLAQEDRPVAALLFP